MMEALMSGNSQKKKFVETESYKHKCAKEVFREWCKSDEWGGERKSVDTNMSYENGETVELHWKPNRDAGACLEYPIANENDLIGLWDEQFVTDGEYCNCQTPTYDECIQMGKVPIAIIDVVIPSLGQPYYFIEICHKNPVSDSKIEKLKELGMPNLIEIDADWILSQTSVPKVLEIKRWLI